MFGKFAQLLPFQDTICYNESNIRSVLRPGIVPLQPTWCGVGNAPCDEA